MSNETKPRDHERLRFEQQLVTLVEGLDSHRANIIGELLNELCRASIPIERTRITKTLVRCLMMTEPGRVVPIEGIAKKKLKRLKTNSKDSKLARHLEHVALRVIELRSERGWTQRKLADKSGLPQSHVCRIERGKLQPTHLTIAKLAAAFGVRKSDIDLGFND